MKILVIVTLVLILVLYIPIIVYTTVNVDWKKKWKKWLKEFGICYAFMILVAFIKLLDQECNTIYIQEFGITWRVVWTTCVVAMGFMALLIPIINFRNSKI